MTPPASVNAGSEICSSSRMNRPVKRKKTRTTNATSSSRMMTMRIRLGSTRRNAAKKNGTLPSGSITRKSNIAAEAIVSSLFMGCVMAKRRAGGYSHTGK